MIFAVVVVACVLGVAECMRRGEVLATSVRYQFANRTVSSWQHVRAADCARFGVIGRTYLRLPSDAMSSLTPSDTVKVQFQFTEPRRRHVATAWLALIAQSRVLVSNATTLHFVHSDRGLLLRVDIDEEYDFVSAPPTASESVWFVRHQWSMHKAVDRPAAFAWLLGLTFLTTFISAVYIFVSSWRSFVSGGVLFSRPSPSAAQPVVVASSSSSPSSSAQEFDKDS